MFGKILIASDLGETSMVALRAGLRLGHQLDAQVVVLHVLSPSFEDRHWLAPLFDEELKAHRALMKREEEAVLGRLREQVRQALPEHAGRMDVDVMVRPGVPADGIAQVASDLGAGLVIVGTRGRVDTLGSVAERVVRVAGRPVMVFPLPATTRRMP